MRSREALMIAYFKTQERAAPTGGIPHRARKRGLEDAYARFRDVCKDAPEVQDALDRT